MKFGEAALITFGFIAFLSLCVLIVWEFNNEREADSERRQHLIECLRSDLGEEWCIDVLGDF